jgi:hypothetical protein
VHSQDGEADDAYKETVLAQDVLGHEKYRQIARCKHS